MLNWLKPRKPIIMRERELQQVVDILFPPLETQSDHEGNVFQIDYSADTNLDAALLDLMDGNNDEVTQKTIRKVIERLNKVRRVLQAYSQLDERAKYLIVDDFEDKEIKPVED